MTLSRCVHGRSIAPVRASLHVALSAVGPPLPLPLPRAVADVRTRRVSYHVRSYSAPAPAEDAWERMRWKWKATGVVSSPVDGAAAVTDPDRLPRAVTKYRARYWQMRHVVMESRRHARPAVIRHQNIIDALREPGRSVELSRPMPLPAMVALVQTLWAEEPQAHTQARGATRPAV